MPAAGIWGKTLLGTVGSFQLWFPRRSSAGWQNPASENQQPQPPIFYYFTSAKECNSSLTAVKRRHVYLLLQAILDVVVNLQFSLIEKLWQTFWRYSPTDTVDGATVTENR